MLCIVSWSWPICRVAWASSFLEPLAAASFNQEKKVEEEKEKAGGLADPAEVGLLLEPAIDS